LNQSQPASPTPAFLELFTPKLVTIIKEGYGWSDFRADAAAGLTVAIVALPLSMAIAIASGASPAQGLYTAIVGGFLVSALGGSRFQIGGPAGAFIVLVAATVQAHGMEGLILATIVSGVLLSAMGILRLGTYVKFIPYPVTVGFTAGIAVIILASQIKPLLGLRLASQEPAALLDKLPTLWSALPSWDPTTSAIAFVTIIIIVALRKYKPQWPGMLIAVGLTGLIAALFNLPVSTIGSEFGGIPGSLPSPALPELTLPKLQAVLPNAVAFALLGAIESLLSAVVADGMTGRRHRSNCELVAQGIANVASGLFGGICVTGTIARTATNVRAGAHGPISGMLHALFLLIVVVIAAPLASYVPLGCLAGVLAVLAWNMVEKHAVATLLRASLGDAAVLLSTFFLTLFRDLTESIVVGFALGSLLFIHRMSKTTAFATHIPFATEDKPDSSNGDRTAYDNALAADPHVVIFRISGAFFFGATASIGAALDLAVTRGTLIIDFSEVPFLDSTAANMLEGLIQRAAGKHVSVVLTGTSQPIRRDLFVHGIRPPLASYETTIDAALAKLRN
jgi:SulP family sulfate permease